MSSPQKSIRLILVGASMLSVVVHGVLAALLPPRAATAPPAFVESVRAVCYTLAAAGLLTSLHWTFSKLSKAADPLRYLTEMIIALALADACSVAGIFLVFVGRNPAEFWPFGLGALTVQGLFILPRATRRD